MWAATPVVTANQPAAQSVGQFKKFESTFQLSKTFADNSLLPYYFYDSQDTPVKYPNRNSPYGVDGITVDVIFTAPSGKQQTVPAFYHQEYTRSGSYAAGITLTPGTAKSWKVRFAPTEVGNYTYVIRVQDKEGTTQYPTGAPLSFSVTSSTSKGFVSVSPIDSRFMQFSNGSSFVPIGSGRQWWKCCGKRSFDYENLFTQFGLNGVNLVRIWDQNDGYGLTVEGHFDAYNYPDDFNPENRIDLATIPQGTQINQRGALELDKIMESAEQNGVYIELNQHEDPYWIWDASIHGTNRAFDDPEHLNYWKRGFRYRVARWGYSTSLLAWETWNEHGHVLPTDAIYRFYQTYGAYQKATDPYQHLRTTSQGSQAYSPAFWSSAAFDIANYHNYMMGWYEPAMREDEANFVYKTAWCLQGTTAAGFCSGLGLGDGTTWSGAKKPWIWGELDVGTANWNEINPDIANGEARIRFLHTSMWAGLFSPLGTTPLDWYWNEEDAATTAQRLAHKKIASQFFAGINYAASKFVYLMTAADAPSGYTAQTVGSTAPALRVYAMRRADSLAAYAFIQNREYRWATFSSSPAPVSGSVTIPGLSTQTYQVTVIDTHTGQTISSAQQTPTNGVITIAVTNLSKSAAAKIVPASGTLPDAQTPAPTPIASSQPSAAPSPSPILIANGDVNQDGQVTLADVSALLPSWFGAAVGGSDQYRDTVVNAFDFAVVKHELPEIVPSPTPDTSKASPIPTATPTPVPTTVPGEGTQSNTEWSQFGHDPQRTSYTAQAIQTPWKYLWQWNGADSNGKKQASHLAVPDMVQPITGGGRVYMVAANSVYALAANTGAVVWSKSGIGSIISTPAYVNGSLFVASENGSVYKLAADTGATQAVFVADGALSVSPLYVAQTNALYVGSMNGTVYALDAGTLAKKWSYAASSPVVTPASYSVSRGTVLVVTKDLYVHALNAGSGVRNWRTKPTVRDYTVADASLNLTEAVNGWPVIAEQHGVVFIRYRLEWQTLWNGPGTNHIYPYTNAEIRSYLQANPKDQSLFALNLDTGTTAFTPAVGNGGAGDGGYLPMGPQPVVRVVDGKEVAYMIFRNGLTCQGTSWCDSREDATMGEMVLDGNTVAGYQAGDMRFIKYPDIQTDEMLYLTMSGNTIFHNHWVVAEAETIVDRSSALGLTFANPIKTQSAPYIIWRQVYCPPENTQCNPQIFPGGSGTSWGPSNCPFSNSRYCSAGLYAYGDQRGFPPGFYEYHNDNNSGSTAFTITSGNLVLVKTEDGGLMALTSGSPLSETDQTTQVALVDAQSSSEQGAVLGTDFESAEAAVRSLEPVATIQPSEVSNYIDKTVTVRGVVRSGQSHLPKAVYLTLGDVGNVEPNKTLLVRVFAEDIAKFDSDPLSWIGKTVRITGTLSLYWPAGREPELVLSSPDQLVFE